MADFLDQTKREIQDRLRELKPLVDEYQRLEAAASALGVSTSDGVATPTRKSRPAPARKKPARPGTGRRGRPKGSGPRSKQALELVTATPGITLPELADAMKIKQNYLYRVLPALAKDGMVTKKGRGWYPKNGGTAPAPEQSAAPAAAPNAETAAKANAT
jgi:hypothetical protein